MTDEPESPEYRYKTTTDQCDVVDREALAWYRLKRYEWLSWYELRKGDPNTIQPQQFSMMFSIWPTAPLPWHVRRTDEDSVVSAQSGLLAHFLDQGYVATQVLAIRRLLDGRKDVFSLRRLLDDIPNISILLHERFTSAMMGFLLTQKLGNHFPKESKEKPVAKGVVLSSLSH
jgi:hypothetical protein